MYRIIKEQIAIPKELLKTTNTTRGRGHNKRLLVPYSRTEILQLSFIPDSIRLWNNLSQKLVDTPSLESFRNGVDGVKFRVKFRK